MDSVGARRAAPLPNPSRIPCPDPCYRLRPQQIPQCRQQVVRRIHAERAAPQPDGVAVLVPFLITVLSPPPPPSPQHPTSSPRPRPRTGNPPPRPPRRRGGRRPAPRPHAAP